MAAAAVRSAAWLLEQEARALLTRIDRVRPFALQETMVAAAAFSFPAQTAVEACIDRGRTELRRRTQDYIKWLRSREGMRANPAEAQRRFTFVRLRFNAILSHFDIFSEAMSQRSETETGIWLAGLDVASQDALSLPGVFESPPVVCYLARGPGAAIRRARTRLPGGEENPIAIIRVPRERMISSGIASSLFHEVGHQGAALLDLVPSLRRELAAAPAGAGTDRTAWSLWERWISEIVADLWSICRVGIASTAGLIAVVSLPAAFVFRPNFDDPHPTPYVRVQLSARLGEALFPHPQWAELRRVWESFYPTQHLPSEHRSLLAALERSMPRLIELLLRHRVPALKGKTLPQAMLTDERQPARLETLYNTFRRLPAQLRQAPPSLAFAVIGQARSLGTLTPEFESELLAGLLRHWALQSVLDASSVCVNSSRVKQPLPTETLRVIPAQAVQ